MPLDGAGAKEEPLGDLGVGHAGGHQPEHLDLPRGESCRMLGQRRTRRLLRAATDVLRNHLKRQLEEMEWLGSLYQPGGLVFATQSGTLINPSNLRNRAFKPLLKRAGLPDICFHDLRHTCATLLLSQGTHPKLVQELLGHATIAMTLDTYSHFLPSMGDQTVRAMEVALA